MNLLEVRQWFVTDAGRYDLVSDITSFADNGADKYIYMGQRWLDRVTEHHRELARVFRVLEAGEWFCKVQDFRVLKNVWLNTASVQWPLEYLSRDKLQIEYPSPISAITPGAPLYYSHAFLRSNSLNDPETDAIGSLATVLPASNEYNGIIIMPPCSEQVTVEILGKFFSEKLVNDTDENFWSINEPGILVMAALRALETFYRNTQGRKDWESAIRAELLEMEKDYIEDSTGYITQLGG